MPRQLPAALAANHGKGRPKGAANKNTATMKAAIQSVYDALQAKAGKPHGHFLAWAQEQPTEFYKLAGKLIPVQVSGDTPDGAIVHRIEIVSVEP
jgi:hypothetical protein